MAKHLSMAVGGPTPQTEQADPAQILNNTGGYVFNVGKWMHFSRFLILGTEGGTYYVSERKLTAENIQNTKACILEDGIRAVNEIVSISVAGRAAKNDYAIFALAMAGSYGSLETKRYAFSKLNEVCRIGTHLFQFVDYISKMRGWGRLLTESVANWYTSKTAGQLAYQVVKYQSRAIEGQPAWSHDDVLRKCHAKAPEGSEMQQVFRWITEGWVVTEPGRATTQYLKERGSKGTPGVRECYEFNVHRDIRILEGYELAKHETDPNKVAKLIQDYGLTHEMIPTSVKKSAVVWEALLEKIPMTAMIRNLGNMSKAGILGPLSEGAKKVREALLSKENLAKARVHPIAILSAYMIYKTGHGFAGGSGRATEGWTPTQTIVQAVEDSFYLSFDFVESTGKRYLIGQDVSASMGWGYGGSLGLTSAQASAVMSMVTVKREPYLFYGGFSRVFKPLPINANMRLDAVLKIIQDNNFGSTDTSVAIRYAIKNNIPVDAFLIYTDNETNCGPQHAHEALREYRQKTGIQAKQVVVGITATQSTIADPKDPLTLDVVGFDTSVPSLIGSFCK